MRTPSSRTLVILGATAVGLCAPTAANATSTSVLTQPSASRPTVTFKAAKHARVRGAHSNRATSRSTSDADELRAFSPLRVTRQVSESGTVVLGDLGAQPAATTRTRGTTSDDCTDNNAGADCEWPTEAITNTDEGTAVELRTPSAAPGVNAITAGDALVTRDDGTIGTAPVTVAEDGTVTATVPDPLTAKTVTVQVGAAGVSTADTDVSYAVRGTTLQSPKLSVLHGTREASDDPSTPAPCTFDEAAAPITEQTEEAGTFTSREIARDDEGCIELVETGINPTTSPDGPAATTRATTSSKTRTAYGRYEDFVNIDLAAVKTKVTWSWNSSIVTRPFSVSESRSHFIPTGWGDWYNHHATVSLSNSEALGLTYAQFSGARALCNNAPINVTFYGNYIAGHRGGGYQAGSPHAGINPPPCFKILHFSFDVLD